MNHRVPGNYLRTYRKRSGLTQREVGQILGYQNQWQVSRHERGRTSPPLPTALAYEVIFRVPVATLFPRTRVRAALSVEAKLVILEQGLNRQGGKGRTGKAAAHKFAWLAQRRAR
ncbi:MAG: helix-turn-helix transcriptional regulator [Bryobacteraceae bacterium]